GMNYMFALRTKTDTKFSNALKAMIIIPMALLGYLLHPVLIENVLNRNLIAIMMMATMALFAFINLRLITRLRS
ncbi:MAG: hypothetical protein SH818_09645, partial [Saprospiraceae bacterium]|nr:hypothetical protein [Saprospiraceae bacterium]